MSSIHSAAALSPRFHLGSLYATPGVMEAVSESQLQNAIARHHSGDWGNLDDEDKAANELALKEGSRLLSAYHTPEGVKFWLITEADRSCTTALLPREY